MSLLFPLGLLALLALPIIVLLHLLRERRKRVVVPSLLLWQNTPRRPDGQRSSVLPVTLLLLLHLLAALALALALAQPRWLGRLLGGSEQLVVVVDTTTSMGARLGGSTRLQEAQAQARQLIGGIGGGDKAAVIALGPQARLVARGAAADTPRLLAAVDELRAGGTGADVAGALTLAQAALDAGTPGRVVVLSDGALPEGQQVPQALAATLDWRTVGDQQDNLGIVTFAAQPRGSGAGAAVQAYARVANYGASPAQAWVRLMGDDRQLDERFVDLAAGAESELTWSLPAGIASLRAELQGGDALAADDTASLSLAQVRPLSVLLVG
jgi:Ca-activated chloride channel family protein